MLEFHAELCAAIIAIDVRTDSLNLCLGDFSILRYHITGIARCITNANNVYIGRIPYYLLGLFMELLGKRIYFLGLAQEIEAEWMGRFLKDIYSNSGLIIN